MLAEVGVEDLLRSVPVGDDRLTMLCVRVTGWAWLRDTLTRSAHVTALVLRDGGPFAEFEASTLAKRARRRRAARLRHRRKTSQ